MLVFLFKKILIKLAKLLFFKINIITQKVIYIILVLKINHFYIKKSFFKIWEGGDDLDQLGEAPFLIYEGDYYFAPN